MSQTVVINGQGIFYKDTAGNGPAVIFMHGFLMDHSMFDSQVEVLQADYRCIRLDSRGFGQTQWDGKSFSPYDLASDCLGLMDHLGIESAVIVGMSQGGYAALRAALTNPKRVQALVLMGTRSGVDEEPARAAYREIQATWKSVGPVDPLIEGLATVLLGPKTAPGPFGIEAHWNKWLPLWKKVPAENLIHGLNCLLDRDDVTDRVGEITCPAFVCHGAEDFGVPSVLGEMLSKGLANCKDFVLIPGGAHAANMTHPEGVNAEMKKFLDALHKTPH